MVTLLWNGCTRKNKALQSKKKPIEIYSLQLWYLEEQKGNYNKLSLI